MSLKFDNFKHFTLFEKTNNFSKIKFLNDNFNC